MISVAMVASGMRLAVSWRCDRSSRSRVYRLRMRRNTSLSPAWTGRFMCSHTERNVGHGFDDLVRHVIRVRGQKTQSLEARDSVDGAEQTRRDQDVPSDRVRRR